MNEEEELLFGASTSKRIQLLREKSSCDACREGENLQSGILKTNQQTSGELDSEFIMHDRYVESRLPLADRTLCTFVSY